VLYIAIAISIVLYYRSPRKAHVGLTSLVLSVHLAANFIWTYLFFGLHCPGGALVDIIVLDLTLVLLMGWFMKANRVAGLLLVPYLIWVLFATYLNGGFYWLN
jgi:tryptophan-rich sensory protein